MSGIDKIIQEIESNTDRSCESVISAAQKKAEAILDDARREANKIAADAKEATAKHVADIKKRGESAADLEEKRVMLSAKQRIISDMLQTGLDHVKNLPEDAYFALIRKMVVKYALDSEGEIRFGEKDIKRLPVGFIEKINEDCKGRITLSDSAAEIDAGFILLYGGIEQNCSFDAIFASESENLCDRAGRLLF
ncbi:MAG: hypothetical protein IJH07_10835 [Ruminococcus sp.]|nr:hypothetical protein [Ruminococcus sp.]